MNKKQIDEKVNILFDKYNQIEKLVSLDLLNIFDSTIMPMLHSLAYRYRAPNAIETIDKYSECILSAIIRGAIDRPGIIRPDEDLDKLIEKANLRLKDLKKYQRQIKKGKSIYFN